MYGAILGGGTKFECALGEKDQILVRTRIPTTTPEETLNAIQTFFTEQNESISALGVGCFGPLNLQDGSIGQTPKQGWAGFPLKAELEKRLSLPVSVDTDVNVEGLGEFMYGAANNCENFIYLTIGTGIGGGGLSNGKPMHGLTHPEMGHITLPKHPDDTFEGVCPSHKSCFEGLASGPAMNARWQMPAQDLPADHIGWDIEAYYIAMALCNYIYILSPERIVLGGGVMNAPAEINLLGRIRKEVVNQMNGYIDHACLKNEIDQLIVPAASKESGLLGALALAEQTR